MSRRRSRRNQARSRAWYYLAAAAVTVAIVAIIFVYSSQGHGGSVETTSSTAPQAVSATGSKPIILYVNQGNGLVDTSNFGDLLSTATSHGFNTIFFQVYRSGTLLFSNGSLVQFVSAAHAQGLKIFFALYLTNSTQTIPSSIFSDGEDGISLDMSTLPLAAQTSLFGFLASHYPGRTAITTFDFTLPLRPDLLVLETYAPGDQQYIHHGIIAGVEVVATSSKQNYEQQVQYALSNSDGVMVFDYAGLVKSAY